MMLVDLYLQNKSSIKWYTKYIAFLFAYLWLCKNKFLQGYIVIEKRRMALNWELVYIQYKEEIMYCEGVEVL